MRFVLAVRLMVVRVSFAENQVISTKALKCKLPVAFRQVQEPRNPSMLVVPMKNIFSFHIFPE